MSNQQLECSIRAIDSVASDFKKVDEFDCGDEGLNHFLQGEAFKYHNEGLGKTFLVINDADDSIIGYYTLRCNALHYVYEESGFTECIPVVEVTRFAIARDFQKKKLGSNIMDQVIRQVIVKEISSQIGVRAIFLLSLESAIGFYKKCGFEEFPKELQELVREDCVGTECKALYSPIE